ncbi:MAG: acylphosphatase [Anaerolineae bacterium]|nr:MAG: acylphosphatase [Anaerolineae bacterium]
MDDKVQLRAIVHGRVQGVNFRYYTCQQARHLGLTGYVRNQWNGTVKVIAEGPRQNVARLLNWLHKGPRMAFVEKVDAQWLPYSGEFQSFEVRY